MTAEPFDAQAIADRVVARQRAAAAASPTPAVHAPLHHSDGPVRTGTGSDTHGLDLPTKATTHVDLFDRLAAAEERRAIHSPFGDHPAPADHRDRIDYRQLARLDLDELERFIAPDIDDLWEEEFPLPATEIQVSTATAAVPASTSSKPATARGSSSPTTAPATAECREPTTCGELLTGGGAPRGWVLVRIIGAGPPKRYCSATCASRAILATPIDETKKQSKPVATATPTAKASNGAGAHAAAERLRLLGITPADVRSWALTHGVMAASKGVIPHRAIDAYLAAHRQVAS